VGNLGQRLIGRIFHFWMRRQTSVL
jgi:hypothetical protein